MAELLGGLCQAPDVVLGPGVGRDAAVLSFEDDSQLLLVAKTDPVTFATDRIGYYAVNVNANDIACMGATPRWFLASALLPEDAPESLARTVFADLDAACAGIGVALVGGHTEITVGLDRPIVVGCMLGVVRRDRLILASGCRPGDRLILTQGVAIEGTAVLAREAADDLRAAGLSADEIAAAARLLDDPGISVVEAARIACRSRGLHAMHDPTEGGLVGAVRELAVASGLGVRLLTSDVPVLNQTRRVCEALRLDPLGLLASGSLLAAVDPSAEAEILSAMEMAGIPARAIGEMLAPSEGVFARRGGRDQPLPSFERDELARYLDP